MATAGELVVLIAAKDEASKALDGIGQKLGGLGKLAGVALAGVAAAGAGFTAAIVGSVGAAMDFESAMSAVGAVAGASSSELAALSQTALQLGQDTTLAGVSASDAAKAMAELASGGISVADIMGGAARGALLLASAGGIDVARAAEIAAAALNNFGLAGSQTGHVADLFAAAANSSAVTVSDLGESMKYIGPIANSMGLSIEEVTAALAELGDQGIKGSQAGTSLRSILSSLAKPSKQASALINELGLEFFDAGGKMKSLAGISEQLKTHLSGLTDQQRANALVTLFGNEALSAATVLYGEGADGIAKYLGQVNVAGSAADNGAKRNDNLKGSIEQLKSSWETLSIVLGTAFIPVVRRVVDGAAGLINTIIGLKDTIGPAVAAILQGFKSGDFNNAFGPILAVIDKVFGEGTSGKVALFVSNVLTFVQNLRNGIVAFAQGIASGFGSVLGAIASLVTGQTTLAQFIGGMEIFVSTVLGNLGKLASQAAPYLGMFLSAIGTFIAAAVPQIVAQMLTWATAFTSWITTTAIPYLQTNLPLWLTALGTWITGTALPAIGTFMLGIATAFTGWITTTAIPYLQTNLPLWLTALSTWITGTALPAIGAFVGQIGTAFGGWITTTAIPYLTTNLPLWLTALQNWVMGTALPAITTAMQGLGSAFGGWVTTTAIPALQSSLPGWIATITGWINSTALPAITSAIQVLAGALVSWIKGEGAATELNKWKDVVIGLLADVLILLDGFVQSAGPKLIEWIKAEETRTAFGEVLAAVGSGTADILDALSDFSANAGVRFRQWIDTAGPLWLHDWDEFGRVAREGIENILTGVIPGIMRLSERMNAWAETVLPKWLTDWGELKRVSIEGIENIVTGVIDGIMRLSERMNAWAASVLPKWLTDWGELKRVTIDALAQMVTGAAGEMANLSGTILGALAGLAGSAGAQAAGIGAAIVAGLTGAILAGAGAVASAAAGVVQGALDAAKAALGVKSPSKEFAEIGHMVVAGFVLGIDEKQDEAIKKAADLASSVAKAVIDTLGAMKALAGFDFAKNSPSGATLGWFQHLTTSLVATIEEAARGFSEKGLKAAGEFADAAGKVSGFIKSALDAFAALASYDFVKGSPTGSALGWFRSLVESLVATIAQAADGFDTVALKAASDFADAAGKVTGFVKGALDAFAGLSDYAPPAVANIYSFGKTLRSLLNDFSLVAEQVMQEAADAAGKFATAIGPVVDVVGKGLDAFTKLVDYAGPPVAAVYSFGKTLRAVVNDFALLSEQVTQESADAAAKFAAGAGVVVGIIANGVAAFTALASFVAPATSAVYEFGKSLRAIINDFSLLAEQITQDATDQAAKFATGAGAVVGIIGGAVEGFTKLLTFVAPSQEAIDNFVYAVFEAVRKIAEMASQMSTEGIELAGEFGDAAGSVLGALKTGLDVFTGLAKLVVPSAKAIDDFGIAVAYTVRRLGQFGDEIGKDGIKHAADFGQSVQTVFGSLKSSMDILTNLAKFKDEAAKAFTSLSAGLVTAIELAQGMVNQSKDLVLQAEEYANNMRKAAALFASGQTLGGMSPEQAGRRLGEGVASGARAALDIHSPSEVFAQIGRDVIAGLVQGMDEKQQDAAKKAADVASAIANAVAAGVAAFTALGSFVAPGAGNIYALGQTLRLAINDLAVLSEQISAEMLAAAATFSEGAGKAVAVYGSGVSAFAGLRDYVRPATSAIYDFGKDLRLALNDLALLAEELTTGTSDLAGKFGEGVAKATGGIANAVAGFVALKDYARVPAAALYDVGKDLRLLVQDFAAIVDLIGADMAEQAGRLGENVGKVTGGIVGAVAGFAALKDFRAPAREAIDALAASVGVLLAGIARAAQGMTSEGLKLAGDFADAGGKAVAIIGNAVSGFVGLATFVTPGRAAVDGLIATIRYVIARFGEMATTMSTEGVAQTGAFGAATSAVLGGVKAAIDTFIALDKAVVPRTGDLSDLVVAVQGVTRNMAKAAAELGDKAIADATAFGTAANGIFTALKSGLDLFTQIDKPGGWPTTDWLQPLIELMAGVLLRGGQLLTQSQELKAIADEFSANLMQAGATFGGALGLGDWALTGNIGGGAGASGGTTINNYYTVTGNTLLSKDTGTQQMVTGIVTATQGRTIGYPTSG